MNQPRDLLRRVVQLAALGSFGLPWRWGAGFAALLAAVAEGRWRAGAPLTPLLVFAAISMSVLLPTLTAWLWGFPKPSSVLFAPSAHAATIGWSMVACSGTVALVLAVTIGARRRGLILLACHAALSLSFLWLVGSSFAANRNDELTVLLAAVVYRTVLWLLIAGGLLWIDATERHVRSHRLLAIAVAATVAIPALEARWGGGPTVGPLRVTFLWPQADSAAAAEYRTATAGYSFRAIGLYGEWARVLERQGHAVSRSVRLDRESLAQTDLAIIASAFRRWFPGEREAVAEWIRNGGRLIVVGEHSDLGGCQGILNPLLEKFGLGLNFDTTNGLLGDGLHGMIVPPDPMARILHDVPAFPYNRGGSLEIRGDARPILIGRYWHADAGDPLAPERAFLSDYRLSPGDGVGDVILMAVHEGRGRVLLLGDSTPFLNQNILFSSPFLLRLPWYMAAPVAATIRDRRLVITGTLLLGVAVYLLAGRGGRWAMPALLLSVGLFLLTGGVSDPPAEKRLDSSSMGVVSTAENEVFDTDPFSARSPTALGLAFLRQNITPFLGDWRRLGQRPRVVAILNPARRPPARAFERLKDWIREGATLLLAGDGESETFREMAAAFGVSVSSKPLGNLKSTAFTTYTAWQIDAVPESAEAFAAEGLVVGCRLRVGAGQAVIFADGGFFLSRNLEMESEFDKVNVGFVEGLLADRPGTDSAAH